MKKALKIHAADNVAVVLDHVDSGEAIQVVFDLMGENSDAAISVSGRIPFAHKVATTDIGVGKPIIKFGLEIGQATKEISSGELVHVSNLASRRGN